MVEGPEVPPEVADTDALPMKHGGGFGAMSREKHARAASDGGRRNRGHKWTPEEASAAGRKGGGTLTSEQARERGRKGLESRWRKKP